MSQDPMGDIPLFREIQKILASSEGPINLEIARQVAGALNQDSSGYVDPVASREFADLVRETEFLVAGYTRLTVDEPARTEVISRPRWIEMTFGGWKWLLTQLAGRFTNGVAAFASERGDEVNPMGTVMGQIAPLLLGMQAGTLIGQLARDSLGRYDPNIPRDDEGHLFFVGQTIDALASEYEFDLETFRRALVLEDVTRHTLTGAIGWVDRYRRSLVVELIDSLEIDGSDLERRLADLQTRGPEALQEGMGVAEMLPIVESERHSRALGNLRAFNALFDGYARHVAVAIGGGSDANKRIAEAMRRRAASPNEGRAMLRAMLGLSFDHALEQAGTTFCAAVTDRRGVAALNTVWDAPDNLPSLSEVRDPFQWIERVLDE